MIGVGLALIKRLLKAYPGIVVGAKDSFGGWSNTKAVEAVPGFGIFTGSQVFRLPTLRGGERWCADVPAFAR